MAIRHKRKATTGYTWQSADLVSGQIGVNTADGTLHVKKDDNSIANLGASSSAAWGSITGTLGDQTDLNTALSGKVSTSVVDAKGDLLVGTANDTVARLAVGTDGYVLTADSNEASGIKWAAASGGSVPEYIKQPVRGATTANLASLSGNLTVDGLTTAAGDRILVKNQTTASQNGIYIASASAWSRASDFDTGAYIGNGCVIPVAFGTVNGGSTWQLVQNGGTIGNSFRFAPVNGIAAYGQAAWTTPTASNTHAIAIGSNAKATGEYSVCVGREAGASACGNYAVLLGTSTQGASGSVAIGNGANANNTFAIRIGSGGGTPGANTISLGSGSVGNFANSQALSSSGFGNPTCDYPGQIYFSTGYWADSTAGGSATSTGAQLLAMRMYTTNATETELGFGGDSTNTPTGRIVMLNHTTCVFDYDIVARNTTSTETSAWNIKFVMQKGANNASTALVGSVTKTLLGQTAGASAWDVNVTADTTNGRPKMTVIGAASTNIRWAASGRFTRVAV